MKPSSHLTQLLEALKTDLINSLQTNGKYATGQTEQQITVVTDDNKATLEIPAYIQVLETGRRPTSPNAIPGDPPMIQRIQQWCRAKGLPDKAAWAIKKSIDKKGYPGKQGILSQPLSDENIETRLAPILDSIADEVITQLVNSITP
jgi:TusA-related sulfurtransferase